MLTIKQPGRPVHARPLLISLGSKTSTCDGMEQTLVEQPGGSPSQVSGYVDLANLADGDTVIMRLYAKVKADGPWRCYIEETYSGVQALPLIYVTKKPENHGIKVTIQQTAGSYRVIDYEFFEES